MSGFCIVRIKASKMNIGRAAGLLLLLMNCMVNAEDTISSFIRDMMSTFHLSSPTIVYDGDAVPAICYTDQWVLCLSSQVDKSDNEDEFEYKTKSYESKTGGECLFCSSVNNACEDMGIIQGSANPQGPGSVKMR